MCPCWWISGALVWPVQNAGPVIDQLADEYVGKAKVAKVDIESDEATKQLAMTRESGIPALMVSREAKKWRVKSEHRVSLSWLS